MRQMFVKYRLLLAVYLSMYKTVPALVIKGRKNVRAVPVYVQVADPNPYPYYCYELHLCLSYYSGLFKLLFGNNKSFVKPWYLTRRMFVLCGELNELSVHFLSCGRRYQPTSQSV